MNWPPCKTKNPFFVFLCFWVLSCWTSLLCKVGELAGGRYVAVAVGVFSSSFSLLLIRKLMHFPIICVSEPTPNNPLKLESFSKDCSWHHYIIFWLEFWNYLIGSDVLVRGLARGGFFQGSSARTGRTYHLWGYPIKLSN